MAQFWVVRTRNEPFFDLKLISIKMCSTLLSNFTFVKDFDGMSSLIQSIMPPPF